MSKPLVDLTPNAQEIEALLRDLNQHKLSLHQARDELPLTFTFNLGQTLRFEILQSARKAIGSSPLKAGHQ